MISRCRARTHEAPDRGPVSRYTAPPQTPGLTHRLRVSKLAGALRSRRVRSGADRSDRAFLS